MCGRFPWICRLGAGTGPWSWLLGTAGIPEGAVPFALADPLRVVPAAVAGGALTIALSPTVAVPHGGFFAFSQLGEPILFAAAVTAGVVVTAAVVLGLKHLRRAHVPTQAGTTAATRTAAAVTS